MVVKYCKVNETPYMYEARYYVGKGEFYEYKMCKNIQEVRDYAKSKYCRLHKVLRFKHCRL